MFKLIHILGNTIHTGTKEECNLILKGLTVYGVRDDKFDVIEIPEDKWMSENIRDRVKDLIVEATLNGSFGDGLERDYAYDGCTIKGVNNMSDDELLEELEHYGDAEFVDEVLAQKATHDILKEDVE